MPTGVYQQLQNKSQVIGTWNIDYGLMIPWSRYLVAEQIPSDRDLEHFAEAYHYQGFVGVAEQIPSDRDLEQVASAVFSKITPPWVAEQIPSDRDLERCCFPVLVLLRFCCCRTNPK